MYLLMEFQYKQSEVVKLITEYLIKTTKMINMVNNNKVLMM